MKSVPAWFMQVVLVFWIVVVAVAYVMGSNPVFGLVGVIVASTSVLIRGWPTMSA